MARQPDAPAGRQRLVGIAAVAALAGAMALAFGRVFTGRAPTRDLVLAALASILIAAALERRSLALALFASGVGLAFAIAWLVFPQTAWYGLPSLRTLRAVGRSLEWVAQQAKVQVAPTAALSPLALAAVTATWTAAFSTHALAARAGSPLLAILPSVALVGFADTVLEDGARPAYAVVYLLAVLGVVFTDGIRRVREWGPVWSARRAGRFARVASRGARLVALGAVLAAVLAPGVLPGFRSPALVDFSTSAGDGLDLDPFVSIQNQLEQDEPVDLFEVTSPRGSYWRLYSLDTFDGTTWSSTDPEARNAQAHRSPASLLATFPPDAEAFTQEFRLLVDIDDPWIPMAYPAETVTLPADVFRYDPDLGIGAVDGGLDEGAEYTVSSRFVAPAANDLNLVRFNPGTSDGRYTFLPPGVDARVLEVAQRWTRGAETPYEQVMAIQEHFRSGAFTYDQDVEPVADADALLNFLANRRSGFCQQFATAMAVLVRELGYPSRVAVGFRQGSRQGDRWTVASDDAHAWVEVYFGPLYGWLPFEPTPNRSNPLAEPGTYLNPTVASGGEGSTVGGAASSLGGPAGRTGDPCNGLPGQLCNFERLRAGRGERTGTDLPPGFFVPSEPVDRTGYSIPYRWIAAGIAAAAVLLLVGVPIVKWTWRRRALRRSRDPRELVLAAYRVFDGEAADLGLGRLDGETFQQHRARLAASAALSDGHLERLTASASRAAYGRGEPSAEEARAAVRDARTAASDLRKGVGMMRRAVGVYRPGL